jgi:hypothetical protein
MSELMRRVVPVLVLVLGWLLGHVARWFADGIVVNAQLYFHAFRFDFVRSPWVLAPMRFLSGAVLQYSALASWAFAGGYWCARAAGERTKAWMAAFTGVTLLGTLVTTTSVRVAQPSFFEGTFAAVGYPLILKILFVVGPAWFAARAVRQRASPLAVVTVIAVIGAVLAWWSAGDLRHAVTSGCMLADGAASRSCLSAAMPWGAAGAILLTAVGAAMVWDRARSGSS